MYARCGQHHLPALGEVPSLHAARRASFFLLLFLGCALLIKRLRWLLALLFLPFHAFAHCSLQVRLNVDLSVRVCLRVGARIARVESFDSRRQRVRLITIISQSRNSGSFGRHPNLGRVLQTICATYRE
jgi:hypothetical protein